MEQTKGYYKVEGKIWSLNNKESIDNSAVNFLSFGIQTSKENSIFVQVGEWKNTKLEVKIKGEDGEVIDVNEQDAIGKVKELFKDGDSVFINARAEVDTYRKSIKYLINQIYIKTEPIDFESDTFEEVNELSQMIIITEKPVDRVVKAGVTTYREQMVELDLKLSDDDVNDYFNENVKVGDLMKVSISVNRKPNYTSQGGEETKRKTLKGKSLKSGGRKIDGYVESLEITDVDLEKTSTQKYDRKEIRDAIESAEVRKTPKAKTTVSQGASISDSDLPF